MSNYRRVKIESAWCFFTVVTYKRRSFLMEDTARPILKEAIRFPIKEFYGRQRKTKEGRENHAHYHDSVMVLDTVRKGAVLSAWARPTLPFAHPTRLNYRGPVNVIYVFVDCRLKIGEIGGIMAGNIGSNFEWRLERENDI